MSDAQTGLSRPEFFRTGAWVAVEYESPRANREQWVSGEIVADDETTLRIEERDSSPQQTRRNDYREIVVKTDALEVYSETADRRTKLGAVTHVDLSAPPWEDNVERGINTSIYAHYDNQMVREGVWEFPDPDYMDRPEDDDDGV